MTASLQAALRAGAEGIYPLEAGTGLLIAHGSWPGREDFGRYIRTGNSITSPGAELAAIDWEAAIAALDVGQFPSSSGEKQMLRLAASLAGDVPVRLGAAVTSIDDATSACWSARSSMPPAGVSFPSSRSACHSIALAPARTHVLSRHG